MATKFGDFIVKKKRSGSHKEPFFEGEGIGAGFLVLGFMWILGRLLIRWSEYEVTVQPNPLYCYLKGQFSKPWIVKTLQ